MLQCFLGGRIRCFLLILDFTYTFPTPLLLFVNFSALLITSKVGGLQGNMKVLRG